MSLQTKIVSLILALIAFLQPASQEALQTITVGGQMFKVEVAATAAARERGLSGRASLPPGQGMLFVFPSDVKPAFWMKEMNFPLDIVWLKSDRRIAGVARNVATSTFPQTFSPAEPIRYVLEINAGELTAKYPPL
jgi:uncharacterized membrane protein (UPF0127 family)